MKHILLVHSHYGPPPNLFAAAVELGVGVLKRESELHSEDFSRAIGMITTTHLDQDGFLAWKPHYEGLLARGGRWMFNGHIMRPLLAGLGVYQPIKGAKRADLVLTALGEHPIFDGVDRRALEEVKGVAGFYGRGHNPIPEGGLALTGLGPNQFPIDWVWSRPEGGQFFSHSGNDLGALGGGNPLQDKIAHRILSWALGDLA